MTTTTSPGRGLGRIPSKPHPKMALFRLASILPAHPKPRSYTWRCDAWLNQRDTPRCVGYGTAHEAAARPSIWPVTEDLANEWYRYAQEHDYWEGTDYDGTSVDGGMQAMRNAGAITSWYWCDGAADVLLALAYKGPVVIGVSWMRGMWDPDGDGWIHATGSDDGGHCTLLVQDRLVWKPGTGTRDKVAPDWWDHLDLDRSWVGVHNSWGPQWQPKDSSGKPVPAKLSVRDLQWLLDHGGEAAVPMGRMPAHR